jgi:putative ABC transport system ATP-binding protein
MRAASVEEDTLAYIEFSHVVKEYRSGGGSIRALDDVSFSIAQGSLTIILGASGAGKTTALNILGGMDALTSGTVTVDGHDISSLGRKEQTLYRRSDIGFVFQFYNLVSSLTALENVELASQIRREHFDPRETLEQVGLGHRLDNFPSQLSGGEQQRVAIARAIAKRPKLLLCDEPTGALDYATGKQILQLLQDISREQGMTVVIITHNTAISPMADSVIHFRSGQVQRSSVNAHPVPIADIEW